MDRTKATMCEWTELKPLTLGKVGGRGRGRRLLESKGKESLQDTMYSGGTQSAKWNSTVCFAQYDLQKLNMG